METKCQLKFVGFKDSVRLKEKLSATVLSVAFL